MTLTISISTTMTESMSITQHC